jgi:Ni/Co efflux regulator RcnB
MKRIILTAIATATLAAPALADQPRGAVETRQHFAASESTGEGQVFFGGRGMTAEAARIHARLAREDMGSESRYSAERFIDASRDETVVNSRAAQIFMRLDNEDRSN